MPLTMPENRGLAKIVILEDNEPVIKMVIKKRWPQLRYVPRTHRIDLDGLFELIHSLTGVSIRHIGTKMQIADIFTKGMFTVAQFKSCSRLP